MTQPYMIVPGNTLIKGTKLRETDKAVHFRVDEIDGEPNENEQKVHWIPLSQVDHSFTAKMDGEDWLSIRDWIAKKLGLI